MFLLYFPSYNRRSSIRLHVFQGAPRPGSLTPSDMSDSEQSLPEVCVCVCVSVCVCMCVCVCLSVCLSVCVSTAYVTPSYCQRCVCLSVCLCVYICICFVGQCALTVGGLSDYKLDY